MPLAQCRRAPTFARLIAVPGRPRDAICNGLGSPSGHRMLGRKGDQGGRTPCKPVSVPVRKRVAAIHLERLLPNASCDLPGTLARRAAASSPIWSCSAWGLPCRRGHPRRRCALTAPFHPCPGIRGGMFSVALSVGAPRENASRPLTGTLPCGDRTFLRARRHRDCPDDRPSYPV